jgi:hypothetical protein
MRTRLQLDILPQRDGITCGPTCLRAIYRRLCICLERGETFIG